MSYQYAASYPSTGDGRPMSSITSFLGDVINGKRQQNGKARARNGVVEVVRRRLFSLGTVILVFWLWLVHWGERGAFQNSINACAWESWERWPSSAQPHRVAFLADPQLVDPHTYPGRPWPLSDLTVYFTDDYMTKTYRLLQHDLDPDALIFLGDLFDGGREWATEKKGFQASENRWKRFGEDYWLNEYKRFGDIFFEGNQVAGGRRVGVDRAKKIIASLPGNHDLGFGTGIQKPVRDRFRAYFGEGNRIDVLGNHTFVSLDTVSLSAMGQPDSDESLWNETTLFLDEAQRMKASKVAQYLGWHEEAAMHKHEVTDLVKQEGHKATKRELAKGEKPELPTIVLTHVPLYREPGTPCGPLRERHPPSKPGLEVDEPNAIRVAAGYQYQNVLTRDISKLIAEKVGNVGYAFSGDDHDYCELVHRQYSSAGAGIREITVKSMSWAMGVRKPGFLLASLWNPVDADGKSLVGIEEGAQAAGEPTIQTKLCLLPDQLGIFIRYGLCAALTLLVLSVHALAQARRPDPSFDPVLPTTEPPSKRSDAQPPPKTRSRAASGSANSLLSDHSAASLSARSTSARTRSVSPSAGAVGYGLPPQGANRPPGPLVDYAGNFKHKLDADLDETDDWGNPPMQVKPRRKKSVRERAVEGWGMDVLYVGGTAAVWWWWLVRGH